MKKLVARQWQTNTCTCTMYMHMYHTLYMMTLPLRIDLYEMYTCMYMYMYTSCCALRQSTCVVHVHVHVYMRYSLVCVQVHVIKCVCTLFLNVQAFPENSAQKQQLKDDCSSRSRPGETTPPAGDYRQKYQHLIGGLDCAEKTAVRMKPNSVFGYGE